jgi:hypothetical protein
VIFTYSKLFIGRKRNDHDVRIIKHVALRRTYMHFQSLQHRYGVYADVRSYCRAVIVLTIGYGSASKSVTDIPDVLHSAFWTLSFTICPEAN